MYGLHFDHHMLSIARDGELVAHEPLAVETVDARCRASGARRSRRRVAGRMTCRSAIGASSAATKTRRATSPSKCSRICARWA